MSHEKDMEIYLCGRNVKSMNCSDDEVNEWLEEVIGEKNVRLVYTDDKHRFNNKGDILMIAEESIDFLHEKSKEVSKEELILRFRPNLLIKMKNKTVDNRNAFKIENEWTSFDINNIKFSNIIECKRCSIIDTNVNENMKQKLTSIISSYNKKLTFGVYCHNIYNNMSSKEDNNWWLHCKSKVIGYRKK